MQGISLMIVTLVASVIVAASRVWLLPGVADGTSLSHVSIPLFGVMVVVAAVLLLVGRTKKKSTFAPLSGGSARAVASMGALFGLLLAGFSVYELVGWQVGGVTPAPNEVTISAADQISLTVSLLAGAWGGVFLTALFVGRLVRPDVEFTHVGAVVTAVTGTLVGALAVVIASNYCKTDLSGLTPAAAMAFQRTAKNLLWLSIALVAVLAAVLIPWLLRRKYTTGWLWLLPVVWLFARQVRYNVTYATAVDIAPAVYDFLLFSLALLFLLAAAQYFAGVGKPTTWLRGLAAATAALAIAAAVARPILALLGQQDAVAYCPLVNPADAGLGLFALALCATLTTEKTEEA